MATDRDAPQLEELVNYTDRDGSNLPARVQGVHPSPNGYRLDLQILGGKPRFEASVPGDDNKAPGTWRFPSPGRRASPKA